MLFYLGTHEVSWLATARVPLFISRRRLFKRKSLPRAAAQWALDSGGFTELSTFGKWTVDAPTYVEEVRRYRDQIGLLDWAAIQDWMCEPQILAKTGLTVADHQQRTIDSYARLMDLAPEIPWAPVLQGWTMGDYIDHLEQYDRAGFNLRKLPIVGLGSVCRRQATTRSVLIVSWLHSEGINLHGFGMKTKGLPTNAPHLTSADSLAWSFDARKSDPLPDCTHANCANCLPYALEWRERVMAKAS